MIEGFFTIMKNEIASTCDQARAIRKENMKRDAAERKLIAIIMLQEQYINEMRDKSMSGDKEGLQSLVQLTPIGQGGVYDHSLA